MLPIICGIYLIRCIPNGCVYVGQAVNCRVRFNGHRHHLRKNKHGNPRLQNAWNAYGETAFEFVVIEECCVADLTSREQHHLDFLRSSAEVFNAGDSADCPNRGRVFGPLNEDAKRIKSEALKGRERSEEHRKNLSLSQRERVTSPETRKKQRIAKLGKKQKPEHAAKAAAARIGKPHKVNEAARQRLLERNRTMKHTPEALEKMRQAALGRTLTPEARAKCSAAAKQYWASKKLESPA